MAKAINRWQMGGRLIGSDKGESFARRLPERFRGKEWVGGSSPPEGSAKRRNSEPPLWIWSRFMRLQVQSTGGRLGGGQEPGCLVPVQSSV
jgi:hypothetical protein